MRQSGDTRASAPCILRRCLHGHLPRLCDAGFWRRIASVRRAGRASTSPTTRPAPRPGDAFLLRGLARVPERGPAAEQGHAPAWRLHAALGARRHAGRSATRGALRPRHGARRALPHRRPPRPGRDGRGLSCRRPEARAPGGAQVPAARARGRRRSPRASVRRGAHGAAGLAPRGLPRVGHRGGRGPALPVHGVRGRGEPVVAAPPHRALPAGQGARRRAPGLRRPRRRAREGGPAPGPEARERDARRAGQGAAHRLRPRRPRRGALRRGRALGDAVLHVARAAAGAGGHGPQRHLLARPPDLRARDGAARLRGQGPRRAHAEAPRRAADRALRDRSRPRPRGRADDPRVPREGAEATPALGPRRLRDALRPRSARGRDRRRRDAVARAGGGGGGVGGPASGRGVGVPGRGRRRRARRPVPPGAPAPLLPRARREGAGRARGPGARAPPPPRARRAGPRRGVRSRHRLRVLPRRPEEGPLSHALGGAAHRGPAGRSLLVPPEPATLLPGPAGGPRDLERPAADRLGDGRREVRPHRPAGRPFDGASPGGVGRDDARGGAGLGTALPGRAARRLDAPRRGAEVDAALPHRRPRGLGGNAGPAGPRSRSASRRRRTAAGRCGSRSSTRGRGRSGTSRSA